MRCKFLRVFSYNFYYMDYILFSFWILTIFIPILEIVNAQQVSRPINPFQDFSNANRRPQSPSTDTNGNRFSNNGNSINANPFNNNNNNNPFASRTTSPPPPTIPSATASDSNFSPNLANPFTPR